MNALKSFPFLVILLAIPMFAQAHDVVKDLENISKSEAAFTYIKIGFEHILPLGFDHILFIISLVLLSPNIKQLMLQSAAFTIGHCFTLGLAMYDVLSVSPRIVEPLIAITIIYVAAQNLFSSKLKASRLIIIFAFGLLHGLGFATALTEIGLPKSAYMLSLLFFNLGVEFGQIVVMLISYFLLYQIQKSSSLSWSKIVLPVSILIICISTYWVFERINFL
jgi:HupE / UreJ protein